MEHLVQPPETQASTWRLWLSYDGTAYSGWQFQPGQPTVENELVKALERVVHHPVTVRVAGRTDSGVHALGQVVSTQLKCKLNERQMVLALASQLPKDISVWLADNQLEGIDARFHSIGKRYRYQIKQGLANDPFIRRYAWHVKHPLNVEAMHEAAQVLVGEHDFESFRSTSCVAEHARRYIWKIDVFRQDKYGQIIEFDIRGNAFCHNMVRIMVGTLVEVGKGRFTKEDVVHMLAQKDRSVAGPTAKPQGLALAEVYYPDFLSEAGIPENACFPRYPVTEQTWPF